MTDNPNDGSGAGADTNTWASKIEYAPTPAPPVEWILTQTGFGSGFSDTTVNQEGISIVSFHLKDYVGNIRINSTEIKMDFHAPVIAFSYKSPQAENLEPDAWHNKTAVIVSATASDPIPVGVNGVSAVNEGSWSYDDMSTTTSPDGMSRIATVTTEGTAILSFMVTIQW